MPSQSNSIRPENPNLSLKAANLQPSPVLEIDVGTFEKLKSGPGTLMVDFYGQACAPCKQLAPILDELSQEMAGKVTIVKMDIAGRDMESILAENRVHSIPTLIVFRAGKEQLRIRGLAPKNQIKAKLATLDDLSA